MNKEELFNISNILNRNYNILFEGSYDVGHKHKVGPEKPITCRFCNKSAPEISFKNEAHAIPELLGNRQLVITDECDSCNEYFAQHLENNLGKYTNIFRVFGQVRGKKGKPKYRLLNKKSLIGSSPDNELIIQQAYNESFFEWIEHENRIKFNLKTESYIPAAVYKALVKIALSVIPKADLINFQHARRWLLSSDHTKPLILPLILTGWFVSGAKPFAKTSVLILKKSESCSNDDLPFCLMAISFGNLQYQIIIPALADNKVDNSDQKIWHIPIIPSPAHYMENWPYGEIVRIYDDLSSGLMTSKTHKLSMFYKEVQKESNTNDII